MFQRKPVDLELPQKFDLKLVSFIISNSRGKYLKTIYKKRVIIGAASFLYIKLDKYVVFCLYKNKFQASNIQCYGDN